MDIHALIGKLPRPEKGFTLPNYKYAGPYNQLAKQLDKNDKPFIRACKTGKDNLILN